MTSLMLETKAPLVSLAGSSLSTECAARFALASDHRAHVPSDFDIKVAIPSGKQLFVWVTSNSDQPTTCQLESKDPVEFSVEKTANPTRYDIIIEDNVVMLYRIVPGMPSTQYSIPMQPPKYIK
jgi:hypothetical protein